MTNNNGYKVFTLRLARVLCDRGFKMLGTVPNAQKPWLNAYVFEDSVELRRIVQSYKGASSNEREE